MQPIVHATHEKTLEFTDRERKHDTHTVIKGMDKARKEEFDFC